jgi:hypothetical protein
VHGQAHDQAFACPPRLCRIELGGAWGGRQTAVMRVSTNLGRERLLSTPSGLSQSDRVQRLEGPDMALARRQAPYPARPNPGTRPPVPTLSLFSASGPHLYASGCLSNSMMGWIAKKPDSGSGGRGFESFSPVSLPPARLWRLSPDRDPTCPPGVPLGSLRFFSAGRGSGSEPCMEPGLEIRSPALCAPEAPARACPTW